MNAKQLDALNRIHGALEDLIEASGESTGATRPSDEQTAKPAAKRGRPVGSKNNATTPAAPAAKSTKPSKKVSDDDEKGVNGYSRNDLEELGYNGMKKLAKQLGFIAKGDREALAKMLLTEAPPELADDDGEDAAETAVSSKKDSKSPRLLGKKTTPDPEPEEEEDPIVAQVNEAVDGMTDEELIEFLTDAGIRAKGKRQALLAAIVKGVRDGKISLEDDEETDDDEDAEETDDESVKTDVNDLKNPDMTPERRAAISAFMADSSAQFNDGDLTRNDLIEFINEYNGSDDPMKKVKDADLLKQYLAIGCLFISDDGEMPDEDAETTVYLVNGDAYCCGHPCKYDEDRAVFICEACGGEYDAE